MLPLQAHNFVDFFHGKRLGGAGKFRHQQDTETLGGVAAGNGRQIDDRNHFSPHVGNAHDRRRRIDHDGNLGHHHDLAHLEHVDAKQLTPVRPGASPKRNRSNSNMLLLVKLVRSSISRIDVFMDSFVD
jgi:hypothetical protein